MITPAATRVLLTGASGGIGQAMATALLARGYAVLGVSRRLQPAPASSDANMPRQSGLAWITADLTSTAGVAAVSHAAAEWGANVLVHAAGEPAFGTLADTTPEHMEQVLRCNLWAPMALTRALLPHLGRVPQARVVLVGSALGRIGLPGFALYGASKAGLHGFAEALRRELADTPIRVQILAPRSTRTGFNSSAVEAYNRATGSAMDSPQDVAQALLALLDSADAERFMGWPERLAVRLNGLVGPLLDSAFRKHSRHLQPSTAAPVPAPIATPTSARSPS